MPEVSDRGIPVFRSVLTPDDRHTFDWQICAPAATDDVANRSASLMASTMRYGSATPWQPPLDAVP